MKKLAFIKVAGTNSRSKVTAQGSQVSNLSENTHESRNTVTTTVQLSHVDIRAPLGGNAESQGG